MGARARIPLLIFLLGCGAVAATAANAVTCSPFVPHTRSVGNKATDSNCTDDTIQSAIDNAVCPNTIIAVTQERNYGDVKLTVSGKSITIVGESSGASCGSSGTTGAPSSASSTTPQLTISGDIAHPALTIDSTASNITLQSIELTGGNNNGAPSSGDGGGLSYSGSGTLTLDTVVVDGNKALRGGGIFFTSTDSSASLTLKHNTQVLSNTATSSDGGGGIYLHNARLFMLEDDSTVAFNHADNGTGGGIVVVGDSDGTAQADIGSPGTVLTGAVSNNSAQNGGGIAALSNNGDAIVRLFSTSATQPVLISQNSASSDGGGVYLKPNSLAEDTHPSLCAYNFRIDSNSAADGAAVYAAASTLSASGANVDLNPADSCGTDAPASLGAVDCAAGVTCNEMSDNSAVDGEGHPTSGSILTLLLTQSVSADRFALRRNDAAQIIFVNDAVNALEFSNCLIADNHSVHEVVHSDLSFTFRTTATFENCTFAGNTVDNGFLFRPVDAFTVTQSILFQPGVGTFDYSGCCLTATYTLSTELATFPAIDVGSDLQSDDPLFVDAANADPDKRNYRLRAFWQNGISFVSPAIDFAPPVPGDDRDLDDNPHDQIVVGFPNDRDLGCYEAQGIGDRIFGDAFGDPLSRVK